MKKTMASLLIFGVVLMVTSQMTWAGDARVRASDKIGKTTTLDDIEAEILFGRDLAARILGNYPLIKDDGMTRYVNLVGRGVALYAGRPELKFYFGVLDSDEVNAFAAPGGYIFVTRAALMEMDSEAELAGVLGHEIAHVVEKHVIKELNIRGRSRSATDGLASLISGSTSSVKGALEQAVDQAADILFKKGYKVADEIEADSTGVLIAAMAGYDPSGLSDFLTRVRHFEVQEISHDGDHPLHEVRINKINEVITGHGLAHLSQNKVKERFYANIKN